MKAARSALAYAISSQAPELPASSGGMLGKTNAKELLTSQPKNDSRQQPNAKPD